MKLSVLFSALLFAFYGSSVNAAIEDFESPQIDTCAIWGTAPDGWSIEGNTAAVSDMTASPCTTINTDGAFSGTQAIVNYNNRVGTLVNSSGPFDLNSFWIHADDRAGSATVRIAGLSSNDTELFSAIVQADTNWTEIVVNWPQISKFTWDPTSPDITNISIDDLSINEANPTMPVPFLSLSGLLVVILGVLLITVYLFRRTLSS